MGAQVSAETETSKANAIVRRWADLRVRRIAIILAIVYANVILGASGFALNGVESGVGGLPQCA